MDFCGKEMYFSFIKDNLSYTVRVELPEVDQNVHFHKFCGLSQVFGRYLLYFVKWIAEQLTFD